MRFEKVENPTSLYDELLRFVFRIYQSTSGKYPRLEWLEEKPPTDNFPAFAAAYGPFLKSRLEDEFDELYVMRNHEIIATFALVYRFENKDVPWIPEDMRDRVYLEFFMVHPEWRGRGIGEKAMRIASQRAGEIGKNLAVVTFEDLDAYDYYIRHGFRLARRFGEFVILER